MTARMQGRPRAWQRMLSGRRLDLLAPAPDDIAIEDIAHGLARVARWNGQTIGDHAFSVAQHSLLVADIVAALDPGAGREIELAALLHDAPEYVVGDLISPFKAALGLDYKAFELRLLAAIYDRFGVGELSIGAMNAIKAADRIAAYYEATDLAGFSIAEAQEYFGAPQAPTRVAAQLQSLSAWPARIAQQRFLSRFNDIRKMRD
jgi:5'-deoxynucleotidase YfbR-like HD superfamily hydrolase